MMYLVSFFVTIYHDSGVAPRSNSQLRRTFHEDISNRCRQGEWHEGAEMSKKTMFKVGALVLLVLWLIFGNTDFSNKFVLCAVVAVGYQTFTRFKAQHTLKENARQGMVDLMAQNGFNADYEHFHSDGNQVSGVAISKDDPRIVLASAAVPAKLFHRDAVLSIASETGKEKDVQFKPLSITGAGDKQVTKVVHVVDVSVKDLDTPRYKLYFQDADHMRQWENRLTAWLNMHATA